MRGRDIQRYQAQWEELWLIDAHNGYGDVPAIEINNYPAVKQHLDKFYPQLDKRYDKGKTPYNLRSCAYHEDFTKEKLFWMDLTNKGRFAYMKKEMFCNNTTFIITGKSLKYLCTFLNSNMAFWLMHNTIEVSEMGLIRWIIFTVEQISIPQISKTKQQPFIDLIDKILVAKEDNPLVDTSEWEKEIDHLFYNIYGLTQKEIQLIEDFL